MKIEASKNHSSEQQRKESKNVYRSEVSVFERANSSSDDSSANAPSAGAFAKILEETRRGKNAPAEARTASTDSEPQTLRTESEENPIRFYEEKSEEKNSHSDADAGAGENNGQNPAPTHAPLMLNAIQFSENAAAARAILHVADLERIVSTIRSQTFQNQKQILIALKNSVLKGLQIKLTVTENGTVKAEFLALDEKIKRQLERRRDELAKILKNRSALFSVIEIKTPNDAGEA